MQTSNSAAAIGSACCVSVVAVNQTAIVATGRCHSVGGAARGDRTACICHVIGTLLCSISWSSAEIRGGDSNCDFHSSGGHVLPVGTPVADAVQKSVAGQITGDFSETSIRRTPQTRSRCPLSGSVAHRSSYGGRFGGDSASEPKATCSRSVSAGVPDQSAAQSGLRPTNQVDVLQACRH